MANGPHHRILPPAPVSRISLDLPLANLVQPICFPSSPYSSRVIVPCGMHVFPRYQGTARLVADMGPRKGNISRCARSIKLHSSLNSRVCIKVKLDSDLPDPLHAPRSWQRFHPVIHPNPKAYSLLRDNHGLNPPRRGEVR